MPVEKKAVRMREQPPDVRNKNFSEVPLGYSPEEAILEGNRCLQCKNKPCVAGCPVNIRIPDFIKALRENDNQKAIDIIHETDALPAVTGRVCPQECQCQLTCVVGKVGEPVAIGKLERFVADWELAQRKAGNIKLPEKIKSNGIKAAIIGSGPAGVSCAADLASMGYEVTVFEGFHKLGGVLVYGIPEFRLPKEIVKTEIDFLKHMGVKFHTNALIGRALTIQDLFCEGFKAIFIGTGAGLPNFMNIPGENLNGIYSANEYLTRVNLMKAYEYPNKSETPVLRGKNVAVIGGGNVAMDSARTALRLGAEHVYLIYRRTFDEMPARIEETHHAKEEGIDFQFLCAPVKYIGDEHGFVKQMACVRMKLGEPDASGRRSPVIIPGSDYTIDIDQAIVAIGTTPNPLIARTTEGLKTKKHGEIEADSSGRTSIPGVFAGGDIVTGAATVVTAMGAGKAAAKSIDEYLKNLL
jgi:glutamate synthase (NADPH/NADH) small chain